MRLQVLAATQGITAEDLALREELEKLRKEKEAEIKVPGGKNNK